MSDLKHTLANLAERGTPIGSERLRERVMLNLASGSSSTLWSRLGIRRPTVMVLATVAATLLLVGALPLLLGPLGGDELVTAPTTSATAPQPASAPMSPVVGVGDGQTVSVTVSGVSGRAGDEMAGVLYEGDELTDLDADALGGFWTVVEGDDFTATEFVLEPGTVGVGRFPFVSDEALTVEPGMYTLVLWVDEGLGPVSRWVPINTYTDGDVLIEGTDLFGCQVVFEVGDDAQTDVAVEAGLHHNGWNVDCATGVAIPGTDAAAAVAPDDMWMPELEMSMPPVVGVGDGQTVRVTVSRVSGHGGDELAGVLYGGGELTDLDADAVGGFWSVVSGDDFTATEVVREPGVVGVGRFPFVSDEALTVTPGVYTLVVWVDDGLGPVSRWVPINTDNRGLFGCQVVFEVGDDAQTEVVVAAELQPDGWNINCTTGLAIPGTVSADPVTPFMPPASGVGEPPFTLPSEILPASQSPLEWRWDPQLGETTEVTGVQELVKGAGCYGGGGDQSPSAVVEFGDSRIDFTLGFLLTPDVVVTDEGGTVTEVGNPFGMAWLCSVAATDTHMLAVGSDVWWSEDATTWNSIEAFKGFGGSDVDGADLMWAAAGPGGYMVLGREGAVWFSEDLQTWYEISLDEGHGYGTSVWGWIGPTGVAVGEEIVIAMFEDGWVGTRRD